MASLEDIVEAAGEDTEMVVGEEIETVEMQDTEMAAGEDTVEEPEDTDQVGVAVGDSIEEVGEGTEDILEEGEDNSEDKDMDKEHMEWVHSLMGDNN